MSDLDKPTQPAPSNSNLPQPAEDDLAEIIAVLKPVPERDPLAAERSQARFMAELEALGLPDSPTPLPGRLIGWLRNLPLGKKKEKTNMSTPAQRFAFSTFALIALIVFFLFGGAGTTVFAAQNALPGDALFQLKTSVEQTQTSLSGSAADRAELHLQFADRRLNEIERLVSQARFNDIASASNDFEAHISAAERELKEVEKEHPDQSALLGQKISDDMLRFNQTLSEIKHQVPDDIKSEVEHAIQAVQATLAAGDGQGVDDRSKATLEPGDDKATPEPGDDKGTLQPGDDKGTRTPEAGDDHGTSTVEPGGDKGGALNPTKTPGLDDKSGKNSSGGSTSPTQTPNANSGSGSGSGSGSNSPTSVPSSGSGSGSGSGGGSGGGSGSGSGGGSGGGSGSGSGGGDGGGHK